jgi:hypothetical protein
VPTEEENSPASRAARWAALGGQDAFGGEPEDQGDDLFTDESAVSSDPDDAWVTTTPELAALVPHAPSVFPVWGLLTEPQETAQLAQLRQWVLFAVQRYELGAKIRPCWAQHGPALEALTALHDRWLEIYLRPGWGGDAEGHMDAQTNRGYEALVFLEQLDTRCDRLEEGTFRNCGVFHKPAPPEEGWVGDLSEYFGKIARTEAPPVSG